MGIFRKKKKDTEMDLELSGGLYLERPRTAGKQNSLLNCLPKGFFGFLVVFGSLGGFVSAFDMECNYVIPAVILFVSAMYFSSLYAFRKGYYRDFGYILYFVFYVLAIYLLKSYVNSGFAAIVNIVRQRGELYFDLNAGTEFAENIEDRYYTITITIIFIGIFEIILLNIFLSNYMSLKLAVFVATWMYVFPLYLQEEPGMFFLLCMLCGFAGIYIFKNSGHFREGKNRSGYEETPRKKVPEIAYAQDNQVYRGILLAVTGVVLLVGIGSIFYDKSDFRKSYVENPYKTATREGVSGFLMIGFRSFFPNLYSSGGMSGGKLGNVSAVRPRYETHLIVRFTPYSSAPVYLKGYTGIRYGNNEWLDGYELMGSRMGNSPYFYIESMAEEAMRLKKAYEEGAEGQAKAVMEIENVAAAPLYVYYPYFTLFDDYTKYTDSGEQYFIGSESGTTNRVTFYPNLDYQVEIKDVSSYIYEEVPEHNQESIDRFLAAVGVKKGDLDAVQKIVSYFDEEYTYSYNPGRLPVGKDVVNYFLDENKKGVCYHFASAATLAFRRLGIPARYVEGYAFGYDTMRSGTIREDLNYEDYYSGYSELGETGVMQVEVLDANAHAWVEIYDEEKGWLIVDPTPSSVGEGAGRGLWNSLTNFWQNAPEIELDGDISGINLAFLHSGATRMTVTVLLGLAVFVGVMWIVRRRFLRWKSWHGDDLGQNLLWYYREVCRRRGRRDAEFARLSVPSEQMAYLIKTDTAARGRRIKEQQIDEKRVVRCLEEICFSPAKPAKEEYDYVLQVLKQLR